MIKFFKRLFCRHSYEHVRNIYGDEIIDAGYYRSVWKCSKCSKMKYEEHMPLTITVLGERTKITLWADSLDDLHEQFYLFKDMHLERQVDRMKKEWKQICDENPNSPEIHPTLISILDNFSTEEYLKTKNI